jgi:hypothetical protein
MRSIFSDVIQTVDLLSMKSPNQRAHRVRGSGEVMIDALWNYAMPVAEAVSLDEQSNAIAQRVVSFHAAKGE